MKGENYMATESVNRNFALSFSGFLGHLILTVKDLTEPLHFEQGGDDEIRIWNNGSGALQTADELRQGINWEDFELVFTPVESGEAVNASLTKSGVFAMPALEEGKRYGVSLVVRSS